MRRLPPRITDISDSDAEETHARPVAVKPKAVKDLPLAPTPMVNGKAKAKAKAKAKGKANAEAKGKVHAAADVKPTAPRVPAAELASEPTSPKGGAPKAKATGKRKAATPPCPKGEPTTPTQPPGKKAAVQEMQSATEAVQGDYIIFSYKKHGVNGTWAIRKRGGAQVCEINVPTVDQSVNKEIAETVMCELNKGACEQDAKNLAVKLKEAVMKRLGVTVQPKAKTKTQAATVE